MRRLALRQEEMQTIPFFAFYTLVFMAMAFFTTYINVYYRGLGFSMSQIGVFAALGPLASIAAQPTWGMISDRTNKRRVLMIVVAGASIMSLLFPLRISFLYIGIMSVLYNAFATSTFPLADAITLRQLENTQIKYSIIRLAGAASFSVAAIAAGLLVEGNVVTIFYYNAAFLSLSLIAIYKMPRMDNNNDMPKPGKGALLELLKNRIILCVLLTSFVFGLTMTFNFAFLAIRITEIGGTEAHVGIAFFIASLSEIPVFMLVNRVFSKIAPVRLLILCASISSIRMLMMFVGETLIVIYIAQAMHGIGFMLHLLFCIVLINDHAPENLKSTAQSLHAMTRLGISALLGGVGGGLLVDLIGFQRVFLLLSIFLALTCVVVPGVLILIYNKKAKT